MAISLQVDAEPIAGYRLRKYLGRGGVGEVWEAEAPGKVSKAVKLIPLENTEALLTDRELQGLAKIRAIRHPYLLSIDRFEVVDGYVIVVMELADKSLADRFEECAQQFNTGIPRDELVRYMSETAEVLDLLASEHGLQHLDIKPENLFLMSGHIKVADFGLVQSTMSDSSTAALAFTPAYAPPELFNGRITASADQYSLAVTYQELLTGQRPFAATSFRELVFAHDNMSPDVSPSPVEDRPCLLRALAKRDEERFLTCKAFVDALAKAGSFANVTLPSAPTQSFSHAYTPTTRQAVRSTATNIRNSKPMMVRGKQLVSASAPTRGAVETPPIMERRVPSIELQSDQDKVVNTFLACVTPEIYAWKLRAFIDGMGAEIEGAANFNDTLLRFRPSRSGWFGRRNADSLFLRIETVGRPQAAGSSLVHATVYCSDRRLRGPELTRRATLLIRTLKSFLMASEKQSLTTIDPEAVRAELWSRQVQ